MATEQADQHSCERSKELSARVVLRMQKIQMEFAFDAYVQGVQLRKATKHKLSRAIRALQKSKLARAWACLEAVSRNEKLSRQRVSNVLLHVCRNTLRSAIAGWQDGVSEQQAERERLAVEHFKLESHKEL
eukprot:988648-Rhodomonas_salina.1